MKKSLLFLALALFTGIAGVNAQYYYIPEATGKNPGNLNTDGEFPSGGGLPSGWSSLDPGSAATAKWTAAQTLPFTFSFNGAPVTSYKVSTSGVLTFDAATAMAAPGYVRSALPSASVPDKSVCIWGLSGLGANDAIFAKTFGTAPNRQLWIHFNSYSYGTTASGDADFTYWSIVLEETTNKIYVVDQRTGGFAAVKKVSVGIQIDAANAVMVAGSPDLASKAGTDGTAADNSYYEFIQGNQPVFDLAVKAVNLNKDLALTQAPFTCTGKIRNLGSQAVTSFKLNYTVNGGAVQTADITGVNIATFATYDFTHSVAWTPSATGAFELKFYATDINGLFPDQVTGNDVVTNVTVWEKMTARKVLHEGFSSSTCPPCRPGNIQVQSVLDGREGKYAMIKYQYNFPGLGDPYYTTEAEARGAYYGGISSVPRMMVDGGWNGNSNDYTTAIFDEFQTRPSFIELTGSQEIKPDQKHVKLTANVKPLIDFTGTYRLRFAVVEKQTVKNIANNGETEFHWVMKKMLPDPNGVLLSMPAKEQSVSFTQEYTFPGSYRLPLSAQNAINIAVEHTVEDFVNLIGVIFIQNESTKEIMQSAWTDPFIHAGTNNVSVEAIGATVYPNPAAGNFTIALEKAPAKGMVRIIDMMGKEVMTTELTGSELTVDCLDIRNGFYMVEITVDGKTAVKKLNIAK